MAKSVRYESQTKWWGWPLVSVARGPDPSKDEWKGHARGIIAIGDKATGGLAIGGISYGIISIGGIAYGGLSLGGISVGLGALGGVALGGFTMGGVAIGFMAFGGLAIGYYAAGGKEIGVETWGPNSYLLDSSPVRTIAAWFQSAPVPSVELPPSDPLSSLPQTPAV